MIASKTPVAPQRPVAGDQERDRIAPDRSSNSAVRRGMTDGARDVGIGGDVAGRNGQKCLPDLDLERRADEVKFCRLCAESGIDKGA